MGSELREEIIRPVSTIVETMLIEAARDPTDRSLIKAALACMRDGAKAKRRQRDGGDCNFKLSNGVTIHAMSRWTAKATLDLAQGVRLRSDTLTARRTVVPQTMLQALAGMTMDQIAPTGSKDIDRTTIRAVLQQGSTLSFVLELEKTTATFAAILGDDA